MTADGTCVENVPLGREVGGDEGKDVQRDAVNASEGVPPFTNSTKRGRNVAVELRHVRRGEATEVVSVSFLHEYEMFHQRTAKKIPYA